MIKARMYTDNDYRKIMDFLKGMYAVNENQHCWLPQRWEYAEHLVNPLFMERGDANWEQFIRIWEENDKIVGIVHPEETCNVFLQIRPGYRKLEPEMIAWAEANIAKPDDGNNKKIVIWVNESDSYRKDLLKERDYHKEEVCSYLNVQNLDKEYLPELPEGYRFISMDDNIDLVKRYNVINKAFQPEDDFKENIPDSFLQMINAPMFRPDLDIVVGYKDRSYAAAGTVWYDEDNKIGMFEPMGTHPDHVRKGLGRAILLEGLRRLKKIGAKKAYVESYGDSRYAFYKSAGFKAFDKDYPWKKVF